MTLNKTLLGAAGGLAMMASSAFANCDLNVSNVVDQGNGRVAVTYDVRVTSSGSPIRNTNIAGTPHRTDGSGRVSGYTTHVFTGASSNDIAALRALIGGAREGRGSDRTNRSIPQRIKGACDSGETNARNRLTRLIQRTADPVQVRQPVVTEDRQPVVVKPQREATPVVQPETRAVAIPARRVIQVGIPCDCPNADRYAPGIIENIMEQYRGQVDDVVYYYHQDFDPSDGVQLRVGFVDIQPGRNTYYSPTADFTTSGGVPQPNEDGQTIESFLTERLNARAKPAPRIVQRVVTR